MVDQFKARWKLAAGFLTLTIVLVALSLVYSNADAQNKTLYWGTRGDDVINAQVKLKNWGYYDGIVDGIYGPKTFQAVKKFQAKNGLKVDGVIGPQTWRALGFNPVYAQEQGGRNRATNASRTDINQGDLWLLSKVVMGEAADEPYIGKVAVAAVILNRVESPKFPDTLAGVVYQPLAFESVNNGQYNREVSDEALKAARDAMNGWDPTGGALYFWNPYKPVSKWIWSRTITGQFGKHVFGI
ncbi:MAG: spore cortex-lytic enzyme [Desulfotomaculum sp.]|nr:spore cortex-lytic enzyme [Desulfotomaculum sp.]